MRALVRSLADSLILDAQAELQPAPWVYTAAIRSSADLVASLTGIACLARELGFTRDPETLYADDGCSASYHVDHAQQAITLAVTCHPLRETVSLALSGVSRDDTYASFQQVEATLFGCC